MPDGKARCPGCGSWSGRVHGPYLWFPTDHPVAGRRVVLPLRVRRSFDFEANPTIDAATVHTLASFEWFKNGQPLCLFGDPGTGKSHMLIALGTEAAMKGYRVRYALATKLVNELVEAADKKQLNRTIARYGTGTTSPRRQPRTRQSQHRPDAGRTTVDEGVITNGGAVGTGHATGPVLRWEVRARLFTVAS